MVRVLRGSALALLGLLATSIGWNGALDSEPAARAQTADIAVAPGRFVESPPAQAVLARWGFSRGSP